MDSTLEIQPKIDSLSSASTEAKSILLNPPQNAVDMANLLAKNFSASGTIASGISAVFPFAIPALSLISTLFDAFSSAPSVGELTLNALSQISTQINAAAQAITDTLTNVIEVQTQKTIASVLQGIDEAQKIESATDALKSYYQQEQQEILTKAKAEIFVKYLQDINAERQKFVADTQSVLTNSRQVIDAAYNTALASVYVFAGDLLRPVVEKIDAAKNDMIELQKIQAEIDDINSVDVVEVARILCSRYFKVEL